MPESFFTQIKPVMDSSWMGALQNQRQLDLENAKQGAEMMRTGTPQEQAIGQSLLRKAGIDTTSFAPQTDFTVNPGAQQLQSAPRAQGPVAQIGQQGGSEAQFYQNKGYDVFNQRLKQSGITPVFEQVRGADGLMHNTENITKYVDTNNGKELDPAMVQQRVAATEGKTGLGVDQQMYNIQQMNPNTSNADISSVNPQFASLAKQQSALGAIPTGETNPTGAISSYQDTIAKSMGISQGMRGPQDQQAIQKAISDKDLQSAQAIANQRANEELAKTPLMSRIRAHAFSQTSSPAQAFGIGMDTIDKLESQGKLSASDAKEMRDNYVMSFNDETFTGTKGAGTGHYYQEKLKQKQRGTGYSYEPLTYRDAAGNLQQGNFAIPKTYAGDWRKYSNKDASGFINDLALSFGLSPEDKQTLAQYSKKNQGSLSNFFENPPQGVSTKLAQTSGLLVKMGTASNQPMYNTLTDVGQKAYDKYLAENPNANQQDALDRAYAAQGGAKNTDTSKAGMGALK
jgi:hypothetical protein